MHLMRIWATEDCASASGLSLQITCWTLQRCLSAVVLLDKAGKLSLAECISITWSSSTCGLSSIHLSYSVSSLGLTQFA